MKIRVFRPREHRIGTERYEEVTERGCHPSNEEIYMFYGESPPITVDVRIGDIIEIDGRRYFYTLSGLELHPSLPKHLGQ